MQSTDITIIQKVETVVSIDYEDDDDLQEQINNWQQETGIIQDGEVTCVEVLYSMNL